MSLPLRNTHDTQLVDCVWNTVFAQGYPRLGSCTYPKQISQDLWTVRIGVHACMQNCFSRGLLFATLWTVAHQAPLSMGFSRQEYWSGLPCLFSRRSFQSRDWTNVSYISCIAGRFLTTEAFRKTGCRMGFSSVTQSCLTLCNPRDCSIPGFPVPQQLLELSPTLVHHIGDAIQPFHPHPLFILPAFNLSQHQGFFQ